MNEFPLWSPRRKRVETVGQWREVATPRVAEWRQYRRLPELARRGIVGPLDEIDTMLAPLGGFRADEGFVEHPTTLDAHRGRFVHDLLIAGEAAGKKTLVTVEGVGDEPLRTLSDATDRQARGRASMLAQRVFGAPLADLEELPERLLYGAAALLIEASARGCAQAVLLVHELRSPLILPQLVADNAGRIDRFVRRLSFGGAIAPGVLLGPLPVPGREALFIGWASVTV